MQRLHEWFRKHKAQALIPILLCLVTVPLALTACGSASSEDTERPKTPFELESEIQSLQADMETIKGDTAWLRTSLVSLQGTAAKDWTADINSLISRLSAIEAKLNAVSTPTPTATSQGGWPVPTATATQSGGLTLSYTGDTIKEFGDNIPVSFNVAVTNPNIATTTKIHMSLTKMSGNADLPIGKVTFTASLLPFVDLKYGPYNTGLDCENLFIISQDVSIANGIIIIPVSVTLDYFPDPPTQMWWSVSFSLQ